QRPDADRRARRRRDGAFDLRRAAPRRRHAGGDGVPARGCPARGERTMTSAPSPSPTTKPAARRWRSAPNVVLFLLCLMYFLTYIDRVNTATAGPQIQKDFHLSNTELGFVFSGFAYPYAIFQVIGGWVGDRMGPRKTLLICGGIWAVATATTGLAFGLI